MDAEAIYDLLCELDGFGLILTDDDDILDRLKALGYDTKALRERLRQQDEQE